MKWIKNILLTHLTCSTTYAFSVSNKNLSLSPIQIEGINQFTSEVANAVKSSSEDDNSENGFISFTLKGARAPRKTKKMSEAKRAQIDKSKEELRGKIREVQGRLIMLKPKGKGNKSRNARSETILLQSTIKFHGATDMAQNFKLQDVENHLKELFTGSSTSEGIGVSEWGEVHGMESPIKSAELQTVEGSWKLDLSGSSSQKKLCKFIKSKSSASKSKESSNILSHDKSKNVLLSPSAPFFQKLGITDANGKPKIARSSKLRQCQKFVEIVSRLVEDSLLPSCSKEIKVVDMGCGRGYLTFSLHSHLYSKYENVQSRGIDVRPKLMDEVDGIARELGKDFDGLKFLTGSIDGTEINGDIDVLIALHACDTATDDSLWYGVRKNASIIVSAPCCHKEARMYLDAHVSKDNDHPYADVFRHNIYKERLAETITDSMRAILLEIRDYNVQVFEFIGGEHTAKNIMITAVKRTEARSAEEKGKLRTRLRSLAALHGIKHQKLSTLMEEPILLEDIAYEEKRAKTKMRRGGMPSL